MDINATSFSGKLLDILSAISESQFVAFDLELSGIPTNRRKPNSAKQTLQERYEEIKQAAERYQILQVGLTCVRESRRPVNADGSQEIETVYTVQPYNFNISPLLPERMGVERIFSFQSGAAEFLVQHGFRIDLPFTEGVPYLSRDEAKLAEERGYAKMEKRALPDIDLSKPGDATAVEFMDDVRHAIQEWQKKGKPNYLDIDPGVRQVPEQEHQAVLSKFEMRLVHQLVRAEFPKLQSFGKRGYVQIVRLDETRELAWQKEKRGKITEGIAERTGFRWIVEWLAGSDMSQIDVKSFARNPSTGEAACVDLQYLQSRWNRAKDLMKMRRPILVGHNLFIDLIYLYRTFLGPLPQTVEEYASIIHRLFPRVMDTKYIATHNVGRIKPDSSLDSLHMVLSVTHPAHKKYDAITAYHEAGYDSLLTACVLIRLSTKLEALGSYEDAEKKLASENSTVEDDVEKSSSDDCETAEQESGLASLLSKRLSIASGAIASVTSSLFGSSSTVNAPKEKKRKKKGKNKNRNGNKTATQAASRFSQPNVFDQLQDVTEDSQHSELEDGAVMPDTSFTKDAHVLEPLTHDTNDTLDAPEWEMPDTVVMPVKVFIPAQLSDREVQLSSTMPSLKSDFWRIYENKLRVFGTEEEVCLLKAEKERSY
ncbi:MAG: hypothetical protein Q9165_000379 [Trypethelium subeluteriae]